MRHIIKQHLAAQQAAQQQQQQAEEMAGQGSQQPKGRQLIRGILVAAGGGTYAANAFVNLWVLRRHLNCTLPVAIM